MNDSKIGVIILAAGGSSRLGTPKQLVEFDGMSLIKHVAVAAIISDLPTLAVLGASSVEVGKELADLALDTVVNDDWEEGISSSIRAGVERFRELRHDLKAVVIMLGDQPGVSAYTLLRLSETYEQSGMSIVACKYDGAFGPPALFSSEMFEELLCLEGDQGAKRLITKYKDSLVSLIDAPEASLDIDTPKDVELLERLGESLNS